MAIASVTWAKEVGRSSAPPIERGCNMRKKRPSRSVCSRSGGSSRRRSISSDAALMTGVSARARAMKSASSLTVASIVVRTPLGPRVARLACEYSVRWHSGEWRRGRGRWGLGENGSGNKRLRPQADGRCPAQYRVANRLTYGCPPNPTVMGGSSTVMTWKAAGLGQPPHRVTGQAARRAATRSSMVRSLAASATPG
jgi:hypothetical protein